MLNLGKLRSFLGLLGVTVDVTKTGMAWPAPLWRQFRVEPPPADDE
jgi:hypothetical protein